MLFTLIGWIVVMVMGLGIVSLGGLSLYLCGYLNSLGVEIRRNGWIYAALWLILGFSIIANAIINNPF